MVGPFVNCSISSFDAILKDRKDQGLVRCFEDGVQFLFLFLGTGHSAASKKFTIVSAAYIHINVEKE